MKTLRNEVARLEDAVKADLDEIRGARRSRDRSSAGRVEGPGTAAKARVSRNATKATHQRDRIAEVFARCREERRGALIAYLMAGDPDQDTSIAIARACIDGGADLLELGSPFSDPVADGPVIQRAGERALANGATLTSTLAVAAAIRSKSELPLAVMTYANPIFAYGERRFAKDAERSGVDGVIIPDLPPEESGGLRALCGVRGISVPSFLTPVSTTDRVAAACAAGSGFLYFVSVTGVTGARRALPSDLAPKVREIQSQTRLPVVIGFGVSEPSHARELCAFADGVVVGSAIVSRASEGGSLKARTARVREFVRSLREALTR